MDKNHVSIKKYRHNVFKSVIFSVFFSLTFFIPAFCLGATLFENNLDNYTDGDIIGQQTYSSYYGYDVWAGTTETTTTRIIQSSVAYEGKSLQITSTTDEGQLATGVVSNTQYTDSGTQIMYVKPMQTNKAFTIAFMDWRFDSGNYRNALQFAGDSKIYRYSNDTPYELQNYDSDTWYKVLLEWDAARGDLYWPNYCRWQINDSAITDWEGCFYNRKPRDMRAIYFQYSSGGTWYIDHFSETPAPPSNTSFIEINFPHPDDIDISANSFYLLTYKNDGAIFDRIVLTYHDQLNDIDTTKTITGLSNGVVAEKVGHTFLYKSEFELTACLKSDTQELCSDPVHFHVDPQVGGYGNWNTPPPQVLPFDFDYAGFSPFETPSPTFTFLTDAWKSLLTPVETWANYFSLQFNFDDLTAQTNTIKDNLKLFRSYIATLDEFFGGVPISLFLTVFILIIVGKTIFMLSYRIIVMIKP